jgi:hypothetical protein
VKIWGQEWDWREATAEKKTVEQFEGSCDVTRRNLRKERRHILFGTNSLKEGAM